MDVKEDAQLGMFTHEGEADAHAEQHPPNQDAPEQHAQANGGGQATADPNQPFWAATSEAERNLLCEQCGLALKTDLATAGIDPGGWAWIVFDTIQRLHHTRVSEEGERHSPFFSPEEIFNFVNTYYAGSTQEWALAITETLKSNPSLFIAHDQSNSHFTIRRNPPQDERLEELAIYALSNNGDAQGSASAPASTRKRKLSEDGSESGPDSKRAKREKVVHCFVPGCGKSYTRLDSFKQHLAKVHEGWNYDSSGSIIAPDGRVVGVFDYYASKPRRKMNEVVRNYPCPVPNCGKLYSTEQIAKTHMRKYHPGIEIPKRIDALPNPDEEYAQQHDFGQDYAFTPDALQAVMKPQLHPSTPTQQMPYQVRPTPTPQLRTQPYNPSLSYSFTSIPTTNFFAALTQPRAEGPAPSSTPFDWNQLNRFISQSLAGEGLEHAGEHMQQQPQHVQQQHHLEQLSEQQQHVGSSTMDAQSGFSQLQQHESYSEAQHGQHEPQVFADQSGQHYASQSQASRQ